MSLSCSAAVGALCTIFRTRSMPAAGTRSVGARSSRPVVWLRCATSTRSSWATAATTGACGSAMPSAPTWARTSGTAERWKATASPAPCTAGPGVPTVRTSPSPTAVRTGWSFPSGTGPWPRWTGWSCCGSVPTVKNPRGARPGFSLTMPRSWRTSGTCIPPAPGSGGASASRPRSSRRTAVMPPTSATSTAPPRCRTSSGATAATIGSRHASPSGSAAACRARGPRRKALSTGR